MALTNAASLPVNDALSPSSALDAGGANEAFKDNIEHLEALEYIARLRLARAYLLMENPRYQSVRRRTSLRPRKPKDVIGEPDLSFVSTSPEEITPEGIALSLKRLEAQLQKKVKKSVEQGIELHFEEFCRSYDLDKFEQTVLTLLIANNTGKSFRDLYEKSFIDPHDRQDGGMSIGAILSIVHPEYRRQITCRKYFSIESSLIRREILVPWGNYDKTTNILDVRVYLHERIVRYVLGDNNIYDVDFQCISRDRGTANLDRVILPGRIKEKVLELAQSYSSAQTKEARILVNQFYGYGTGLVFLFHGPSGTGKTMLAHALAACLKKELLSVNMEYVSNMFGSSEELIKYVFKEAKLSDAIVFFDECDEMFHASSRDSRTLLVEIEKAECIVIMATNRVVELDPAMDRRITMKVSFFLPDEAHRERIWKALVPPNVSLGEDVDFNSLAKRYVFTGGLIKNALFTAVTNAVSKNGHSNVVLTADDIEQAAEWQSASMFDLCSLGRTYVPKVSMTDLSLRSQDKTRLQALAGVCSRLTNQSLSLRLLLGCSDTNTGIHIAQAVARECGLKVREFHLPDLFVGQNSADKITDPITRRQINPLDYVFKPDTGLRALTVLVDHESFFEHLFLESPANDGKGKDLLGFYGKLRQSEGIVFLVTRPVKMYSLPIEFSHYLEIHPPPEELQFRKWEEHLGDGKEAREQIIEIVEQHPLHLDEISMIVQMAKTTAYLNGNETMTLDDVHEVLKRLKSQERVPVLFGKGDAQR